MRILLFVGLLYLTSQQYDTFLVGNFYSTATHNSHLLQHLKDFDIDTFVDDFSENTSSDNDQLLIQAESLFQDENPLIEQMLEMAQGFGDGGVESQIILSLDDAKDQTDTENSKIAIESVVQNETIVPILNTDIQIQSVTTKLVMQDEKLKALKETASESLYSKQDSLNQNNEGSFSWKDFGEKLEFFFGSIIVFVSFPLLWHVELRRFRCLKIKEDFNYLLKRGFVKFISGKAISQDQFLIDPIFQFRVQKAIRLFRKVELLKLKNDQYIWVQVNENEQINSCYFDSQYVLIKGFEMCQSQIEQLKEWHQIPLRDSIKIPLIENLDLKNSRIFLNNLYLTIGGCQFRISFWQIQDQDITIVCDEQENKLRSLELHLSSVEESKSIDEESLNKDKKQYLQNFNLQKVCDQELCQIIRQWLSWNEFQLNNYEQINFVQQGKTTIDKFLVQKVPFTKFNIVVIRALIFLLMVFGVWLFFLPIYQILQLFPLFGALLGILGGFIGAVVGALFATIFCLVTIGISFIFYKPKMGLSLIITAGIICILMFVCSHFDYQLSPEKILDLISK